MIYSCQSNKHSNQKLNSDLPGVILDTDMGNYIDDVLALDAIYKYADSKQIQLLAIMSNIKEDYSPEYLDIMNFWYGYPQIPIGINTNGVDCERDSITYAMKIAAMQDEYNNPIFKRSLSDYTNLPTAIELYRKTLSQQPDSSVTILSIGFSTNLAQLLDTKADKYSTLTGKELITKKVKLLCTMAGCFNEAIISEYNIAEDILSAQKVFHEWPTTLITLPFEVGANVIYPSSSIKNDFNWCDLHPLVESYKLAYPSLDNQPTWDICAAIYAIEKDSSYFTLSKPGTIHITNDGTTQFSSQQNGKQFYLITDSIKERRIEKRIIELATQKPLSQR